MRRNHFIIIVIAFAYAIAAVTCTSKLKHAWWYLQENANRRFSSFIGLSAASIAMPWCIPDGVSTMRNLSTRGEKSLLSAELFNLVLGPGANSEPVDTRMMTRGRMKAILGDYSERHGGYRLWCVGLDDYILTAGNAMTDFRMVLDAFGNESKFEAIKSSRIYSPAEFFSCYVGSDADLADAFAGISEQGWLASFFSGLRLFFNPAPTGSVGRVQAATLTPFAPKFPSWLEKGEADANVYLQFEDAYENVQEARREILIGFGAAESGNATNAVASWAKAAKVNRRDPLLTNLAAALDREGKAYLSIGNVNGALRCYEHRLEVFPYDIAAVHNFAVCLKKAGHMDPAAQVFAKAVEMDPKNDVHRLEMIECAAAGGHEDIAVRQLDVLIKRHPNDLELKKRRAKILVHKHLETERQLKEEREKTSPNRYLKQEGKK